MAREFVKGYLVNEGLNESQIYGIMANLKAESGFDSGVHEGHVTKDFDVNDEYGYGLAQWTSPSRKQGLLDLASSRGVDVSDRQVQMDFLMQEIGQYGDMLDRMGQVSPQEATGIFMREFERPYDQSDTAVMNRASAIPELMGIAGDMNAVANYEVSSDPFKEGVLQNFDAYTNAAYSVNRDPQVIHPDSDPLGRWGAFKVGFADAATTTGFAHVAQLLWGRVAHSDNPFGQNEVLSKEDMDFVKQALPNDPLAQKYALLNARDRSELEFLVNQKQVDRKRREAIEQYNKGALITFANAGQLAGNVADPLNLVGFGEAYLGAKVLARLGSSVYDISKVAKYAKLGAMNAATMTADIALRDKVGYEDISLKDYGLGAALGFVSGVVLGGIGDALGHAFGSRKNPVLENVAARAEDVQTYAIKNAADFPMIKNETRAASKALSDTDYLSKLDSKLAQKFTAQDKVYALSMAEAKKLVGDASGIQLDPKTKAFYVPNEDYTILIKDNVKVDEIDNLLAHEIGVHGGMRKIMGQERFDTFMDKVRDESSKEGTALYEARRLANSYDPEEIFAYAIEHDMLRGGILSALKNRINRGYKEQGFDLNMNTEQLKDMLMNAQEFATEVADGIWRNPDGSTAFAGIKFSKDNMLNPELFAHMYQLEQVVTLDTQALTGSKWLGKLNAPIKMAGKKVENWGIFKTPYGTMANSMSNTMRKYAGHLVEDVRGRGLTKNITLTAEANRQRILNQLMTPYIDYAQIRMDWVLENKSVAGMGMKSNMEFDRQAMLRYNEKYGGNTGTAVGKVSDAVEQAADKIHEMRNKQIELGKSSADAIGHRGDNLIEKDWESVDKEIWRQTDEDLRQNFYSKFQTAQESEEFLVEYFRRAAQSKRDLIEQKMSRSFDKEAKAAEKAGTEYKRPTITEEMIDNYIDTAAINAVEGILKREINETIKDGTAKVGDLSFFRERLPADTSLVVKLPNGQDFSFDNDLRDFNLDRIFMRNSTRFAGEAAIKNVFKDTASLEKAIATAEKELDTAVQMKKMDRSQAESELQVFKNTIDEIRGYRQNADAIGKMGALANIFRNLAYAKNGAMMGFAQLGELGGAIAYGGLKQAVNVVPGLPKFLERAKLGKLTNSELKDAEFEMFGQTLEPQIWSTNWNDMSVRSALTQDSLINKALTFTADATHNLGKVTSTLNMLPKMTDQMVRGMRRGYMGDSIRWANGEEFSKSRNPFSAAKLRASGITPGEVEALKAGIKANVKYNADGSIAGFDWKKWQADDPTLFSKWYRSANVQAERAIVSATTIGNKNVLKDANSFTRLAFQFKDYSGRAWNAQTMRAMTSGDFDDGAAAMLSIVTNTAAYGARAAVVIGALSAVDMEKAKEMTDVYFDPSMLARAAATRSAIVGTPFSYANDVYEAISGEASIRTTVDRMKNKNQQDRNMQDITGDFISQIPAIKEAGIYTIGALNAMKHFSEGRENQRDAKALLNLLPIPNIAPLAQFMQTIPSMMGLPEKRPKQ